VVAYIFRRLIAAAALLTPGTRIPDGSLVMGSPGKVRRSVTEAERAHFVSSAANYVGYATEHRAELLAAVSAAGGT